MEFRVLASHFTDLNFFFVSREELSIENEPMVRLFFKKHAINYCINCAAYTAVDKAESEKESALSINASAPGLLASICAELKAKLIHFSTDYVFSGDHAMPYKEEDETSPVNFYGETKLLGEQNVAKSDASALIIRTSWVYSSYGKNFVKTMLRLMKEKDEISVVNDQSGCPTYAADLAAMLIAMIRNGNLPSGIFHYANRGVITWYDFATAIKEISHSACVVKPIPTTSYPTPAKRPVYSALDSEKIRDHSGIEIPQWRDSLEKCIALLS